MKKHHRKSWGGIPLLVLLAFASVAAAQVPQVTITAPSNISNPLLLLQDFSGDTGVVPLFQLVGGLNASTVGIEVTSQSGSTASVLPNLGTIMGTGFGGLSLVQTNGAAMGAGASSPFLSMCAQQFDSTNGTGAACWSWQVQGGAGSDPPDVFKLTRSNATNSTHDVTVLFPPMINLATTSTSGGVAGQITVGPAPITGASANVLATFTGAGTSATASAAAGPAVIQAGQLTAPTTTPPDSSSTEGAFEIMQSYRGTLGASNGNIGLLACPDTSTTQGVVPCAVAGQAENWVGVYNDNPAQVAFLATPGVTVTPTRYGRVTVQSKAGAQWLLGDFVCKDDSNASYSIDNNPTGMNNVPCSAGESVGIVALGDTGNVSSHTIDLVPAPSQQGGALMTFFCSGTVLAGGTMYMFPGAVNANCNAATAATEMQPMSFSGTIKNLVVFYGTAPGATHNSDTFTVYKCPALASCAATSLKCRVINGAAVPSTCSDFTDSVAVSQGDGIQIVDVAGAASVAAAPRVTIQIQ